MKNDSIKFAVVGCGHIGKRHAEMIRRNSESELVAFVDTASRASLHLEAFNDIPFFHSLELLFQSGIDVDVITIATPNGVHAQLALKALGERKHVVIEKPMALTRTDAENVLFKALSMNRQVFSVMQNRYSPPSIWLKQLVESHVLGQIFQVQINCYWNRDERYYRPGTWHGSKYLDGGTLFTQFSHFIDILYWVFGDIRNIHSRITCHNHSHLTDFEDSGFVTFDFVRGGIGCLSFSTSVWDKNMESSLAVIAEHGSIKIGGQYMNEIEHCHIAGYEIPDMPPTNPANDYGSYKGSAANHQYVIDNVVSVLKGSGSIATNALEGLKVVDIIERIYNSAATVSLPSPVRTSPSSVRAVSVSELQTA